MAWRGRKGVALRVLGLDPGVATTGFAVVERNDRGGLNALVYGVWRTSPQEPHAVRLAGLRREALTIIEQWQPDAVAVERLFFNVNVRTAMPVGQASGVLLAVGAEMGLEVFDYSPPDVKLAVAGSGSAGKKQMQQMVTALLRLPEVPRPPDAADACALAICHLNRGGLRNALKAAGARL